MHDRPVLASFLPEAGMTIFVGIIAGCALDSFLPTEKPTGDDDYSQSELAARGLLTFSSNVFFTAFLVSNIPWPHLCLLTRKHTFVRVQCLHWYFLLLLIQLLPSFRKRNKHRYIFLVSLIFLSNNFTQIFFF